MRTVTDILRDNGIRKTMTADGIRLGITGIIQGTTSGIIVSFIEIEIGIFIAREIVMDTDSIGTPSDIEIFIEKDIEMEAVRIGAMTTMT